MGFAIPLLGQKLRNARLWCTIPAEMRRVLSLSQMGRVLIGLLPARTSLRIPVILVIVAFAMFTIFTIVSYGGTCSKLPGFPGLLQEAGMVAAGPCASTNKGQVCSSAACTTADRKPGKCQNIAATGPANCVCVERTVSKTLR